MCTSIGFTGHIRSLTTIMSRTPAITRNTLTNKFTILIVIDFKLRLNSFEAGEGIEPSQGLLVHPPIGLAYQLPAIKKGTREFIFIPSPLELSY
jgi:hypothetical protein